MAAAEPEKVIFPPGTQINCWTVREHIGHGGYGEIYEVVKPPSDAAFAMKTESRNARKHGLNEEVSFLSFLQGTPYFPRFLESGETAEILYFVMELLGPTVSVVRRALPDQRYTRLTATVLAKEMLECIEELHKRGLVHRDIKPGNFLFRTDQEHLMCVIDFGLSRRFVDPVSGEVLPARESPGFVGTCSFASIHAHDGKDLGRRDDIISWLYTIVEITERGLPWPGSKNREATYQTKKSATAEQLCRSLPAQFMEIYDATMRLEFEDEVDYQRFYRLLNDAICEEGGEQTPFDWERLDEVAVPIAALLPKRSLVFGDEPSPDENVAPVVAEPVAVVSENASRAQSTAPPEKEVVKEEEVEAPLSNDQKKTGKKKKKEPKADEDEPICQGCFVA
jgi:hypothetical protein